MSDNKTTYEVSTVFVADSNKATKGIDEIAKSAEKAAQHTGELANILKGLAVSFGVYKAFEYGKHAIFGANSELEQHKVKLAGMLSLYSGVNIDRSFDRATLSMKRFNDMSWQAGVGVADLVKTAGMLQGPLLQAGMTVSRIEQMSLASVKVAGAFGKDSSEVAGGVMSAIMRGKAQRDPFIRSLLAQSTLGISPEKFEKMKQSERASVMEKALSTTNMNAFVEKQSNTTFDGAMGNIKAHLAKLAEHAGQPLFEAATKELIRWQTWIEKNRGSLESAGHKVGEYLMSAFNAVKEVGVQLFPLLKDMAGVLKDVMSFAANNKDVLIGLAKALLVMKVGEKIGGLMKASVGGISGLGGAMSGDFAKMKEGFVGLKDGTGSLTDAFGNMGKVLGGATGLIGGLAQAAVAAWSLGKLIFGQNEHDKEVHRNSEERQKVADDYRAHKTELKELQSKFTKLQFDPEKEEIKDPRFKAEYARMKELEAGKAEDQNKVIDQMIKQGTFKSEIHDGKETLTYMAAGNLDYSKNFKEDIATRTALQEQADAVWKELGGVLVNRGTAIRGELVRELTGVKPTEDVDKGFTAKPPEQHITINIQQVMAKDPNRWLADMDDMVNKRNRARTRSTRQFRGTPQ